MKATVRIAWQDIDAPMSSHAIEYDGDDQHTLLHFLLHEGSMLQIAIDKARRWLGKSHTAFYARPIHKSSIHETHLSVYEDHFVLSFYLNSTTEHIRQAKWDSSRDCPKVGEWVSASNTGGMPVLVMGYYVSSGRRNIVYALPHRPQLVDDGSATSPRLTIGTIFGRDWS